MENLLRWTATYLQDDPIIVATWLHHRFTQIHPYHDGNGRLARALTTVILLRSDLLPLVIDRDLRVDYLDALESADLGNMGSLTDLFAKLERNAILQALSVNADGEIETQRSLTEAVIHSLVEKFARRKENNLAELRNANNVALSPGTGAGFA